MTRKRLSLLSSAALVFISLTAFGADVPGFQLVRQGGTDKLDTSIADQTHGYLKWSHGAFLYADIVSGLPPVFHTLSRDGDWISSAKLEVPDKGSVWTAAFDRGTDGSIVVSGGSWGDDSPFIGFIAPDGKTSHVVDTGHYHPYMVSVAPDGTVWTMGFEMINHNVKAPELDANAGVLRHFDNAGKEIGSFLPQSQFTDNKQTSRLVLGFLVATHDRLGWYSSSVGSSEGKYVEIPLDTMKPRSYAGLPANFLKDGMMVVGFALTDAGKVSLSVEDRSPRGRTAYSFDRLANKWAPFQVPSLGGFKFAPHLMGTDGEQFVFQCGHEAAFFEMLN